MEKTHLRELQEAWDLVVELDKLRVRTLDHLLRIQTHQADLRENLDKLIIDLKRWKK